MELVDGNVLEVGHLKHVGGQESPLEAVHVTGIHPSPVDVGQDDSEDPRCKSVDGDGLLPGLGHAAGEHGQEVLAVGRQHDPVRQESLPIHQERHVCELIRLIFESIL